MDDARRQVLLAELAEAKQERDDLSIYIKTLSARLGLDSDPEREREGVEGTPSTTPSTVAPNVEPAALVYEGEFIGVSLPKAAAEVLRRYSPAPHKRPVKTPALVTALKKGGASVDSPRQLYKTLYNARALHAIKGGQWGFAAWYPEQVRAKAVKAAASTNGEGTSAAETADITDMPSHAGEGSEGEGDGS